MSLCVRLFLLDLIRYLWLALLFLRLARLFLSFEPLKDAAHTQVIERKTPLSHLHQDKNTNESVCNVESESSCHVVVKLVNV
jgi:hypothetical protein